MVRSFSPSQESLSSIAITFKLSVSLLNSDLFFCLTGWSNDNKTACFFPLCNFVGFSNVIIGAILVPSYIVSKPLQMCSVPGDCSHLSPGDPATGGSSTLPGLCTCLPRMWFLQHLHHMPWVSYSSKPVQSMEAMACFPLPPWNKV